MKKRILIKISGAYLKGKDSNFDIKKIQNLALQIKELSKDYQIGIVVGGGNIFRGNIAHNFQLDHNIGDQIGMLATVMNGILLQDIFLKNNINSKVYSAIRIDNICNLYNFRNVNESLNNDVVCIFVSGTGSPFFTTDTGASLRACEINADIILMGKNGVDGVYDKDPLKHKDAIHYDKLTYKQVIEKDLKVMDLSSLVMCQENNISILVFNIDKEDCFIKSLNNKIKTTLINKGE